MAKPPRNPQAKGYDERIYRKGHPPHRMRNALILIVLVIVGTYLAWTKSLPFGNPYELHAVFRNAANIRKDSPVRIAGVNVGKVESVKSVCADATIPAGCAEPEAAEVTFTVDSSGQPIHSDAQVQIRPRIFLEGNFFLDVHPGSPSAGELSSGDSIPITQTATAVQLDQILTSLQAPDRANLQKLLAGYGTALTHKPTAAEDATQDPEVQGLTAAQAVNKSFDYGQTAARDAAIVNEALQGTEPHDLSTLIGSLAKVTGALSGHESQLQGLVVNLNTTLGALAAESGDLERSIRLLGPTLELSVPALRHTNQTLPFLRTFARELTPGIRELPATIAASGPWLKQASLLLSRNELGYIADELRRAAPGAALAASQGQGFFSQTERLSNCFTKVLLPAGDVVLDDSGPGFDFSTGVPNFKEFGYAATQLAGSLQNFDGNGPFLQASAGNGPVTVTGAQPGGGPGNELFVSHEAAAPIGTRPVLGSKPPFNTGVACQNNPVPDLNGPAAALGSPSPAQVP
jgi:phospholipid/cholesterol/gamma-HCH transport system substrate-binding protein